MMRGVVTGSHLLSIWRAPFPVRVKLRAMFAALRAACGGRRVTFLSLL